MLIGYARVSTLEQNLDLQNDALKKAGCEKIYTDTMSGAKAHRPGLDECLAYARPGDTVVVWKLDRLGRNLKHLIETVQALDERGIGFKSVQESIDTTTPGGKLVFHVFGALAEFERDLIRERTNAGLAAARARGRTGGRKPVLDAKGREVALALFRDKSLSVTQICKTLGVSRTTFYRCLPEALAPKEEAQTQPKGTAPQQAGASAPAMLVDTPPLQRTTSRHAAELSGASTKTLASRVSASSVSASPPDASVAPPEALNAPADLDAQRLTVARVLMALDTVDWKQCTSRYQEARRLQAQLGPTCSRGEELRQWAESLVNRADNASSTPPLNADNLPLQ